MKKDGHHIMADLDFDELHKNIKAQMSEEPAQSPYSERRKSTRRMAANDRDRRDSTRDEVAINVKVNKTSSVPAAAPVLAAPAEELGMVVDSVASAGSASRLDVAEAQTRRALESSIGSDVPYVEQLDHTPDLHNPVAEAADYSDTAMANTEHVPYIPPHENQSMAELQPADINPPEESHHLEPHASHGLSSHERVITPNSVAEPSADVISQSAVADDYQSKQIGPIPTIDEITPETVHEEHSDAGASQIHNESSGSTSRIWDILYYLIVTLLILVIISLVLVLLDRFGVIDIPSSVPIVGLL